MVLTWTHGIDNIHDIDLDSWYSHGIGHGLIVSTYNHGKYMDSWNGNTHGIYFDSWYRISVS